jgi:hypothetical protein
MTGARKYPEKVICQLPVREGAPGRGLFTAAPFAGDAGGLFRAARVAVGGGAGASFGRPLFASLDDGGAPFTGATRGGERSGASWLGAAVVGDLSGSSWVGAGLVGALLGVGAMSWGVLGGARGASGEVDTSAGVCAAAAAAKRNIASQAAPRTPIRLLARRSRLFSFQSSANRSAFRTDCRSSDGCDMDWTRALRADLKQDAHRVELGARRERRFSPSDPDSSDCDASSRGSEGRPRGACLMPSKAGLSGAVGESRGRPFEKLDSGARCVLARGRDRLRLMAADFDDGSHLLALLRC